MEGERSLVNGQFPHPAPGGGMGLIIDRCIKCTSDKAGILQNLDYRLSGLDCGLDHVMDWAFLYEMSCLATTRLLLGLKGLFR